VTIGIFAPVMRKDITAKIKKKVICYPNMSSTVSPVVHGPDIQASPKTLSTSPSCSDLDSFARKFTSIVLSIGPYS
jgi:hypothetical protein